MDAGTTITFALAFLVFAASPGPDNLMILSKTATEGPAQGIAYGCGVVASIVGFVVAAALGLDALAGAAGEHLRALRYIGAAYLVYTGIRMWRAPAATAPRPVRGGLARLFGLGFLLNVSNPKMPIFYLALLPGALGAHRRLSAGDAAGGRPAGRGPGDRRPRRGRAAGQDGAGRAPAPAGDEPRRRCGDDRRRRPGRGSLTGAHFEQIRQPRVDTRPQCGAAMPLYYFDLYDNEQLARDEFGLELESLYEARDQALALLPDMARQGMPDGDAHDYTAVVRCREGRVRYEAKLSLRGGWVEPPTYPPPKQSCH